MYELYRAGCKDEARGIYYQSIGPMNVIAVPGSHRIHSVLQAGALLDGDYR
jgi:hypothetical protein